MAREGVQMETVDVNSAMEKQIPKAPVEYRILEGKIEMARCPRCNYDFPDIGGINEYYGEVEQYDYCPYCGQRIDWGGVM